MGVLKILSQSKPSTILGSGAGNRYLLDLLGGYRLPRLMWVFVLIALCLPFTGIQAASITLSPEASQFKQTWALARAGKHSQFRQQMVLSKDYLLYPYLEYEDYRSRLPDVSDKTLASFLKQTKGWAFNSSLRQAWLRGFGRRGQWQQLVTYAGSFKAIRDTETQCNFLRAGINLGQADSHLIENAKSLWLTGKSQHKACDPVFSWLEKHQHISTQLLWKRILLALKAGNINLSTYLSRRLPEAEQQQAIAYQQLWRRPGRGFSAAERWPDSGRTREFILAALLKQIRANPDTGQHYWNKLASRFAFSERARGIVLYDLALYAAVDLDKDALYKFAKVPQSARDDRLLQWRLRTALKHRRWDELLKSYQALSTKSRQQGRYRFWQGWAMQQLGQLDAANKVFKTLAREATFWGFLAADQLHQDYRICPLTPKVEQAAVAAVAAIPGIARAFALLSLELDDYAGREWYAATAGLNKSQLRAAAALAVNKNWPSRAILTLAKSGDTRFYQWRFPIAFEAEVNRNANKHNLDPAWIYGLMRAESAMNPRAISPAKAYGLMQLLPGTAKRLSKSAGVKYRSSSRLLEPATNIAFGTAEMKQLLQRYNGVPAYVTGAYNAGPGAVDRWLEQRGSLPVEQWLELMPYYETRDYIPRVMAFATLYAWRLGTPVSRVSFRLRHAQTAPGGVGLTNVSCQP